MVFDNHMAAATTNTGAAGERGPTMGTDTHTEDRAAWVAAGRPSDHPYMAACRASVNAPRPTFVAPLAIELSAGQVAHIEANASRFAAESAANIRAMMAAAS